MGAVCYKPKKAAISKQDILRALNDKHIKESITEPDGGYKTSKTEDHNQQLMTFSNFTYQINIDTSENIHHRGLNKKQQKILDNKNARLQDEAN